MRSVVKTMALTAALVLAGTGTAVAAPPQLPEPVKPKYRKTIQPSLFGMHVHGLSNPVPQVNQRFGAIRIWDNGVRWDEINTARDVYDFTLFDRVLAHAAATGPQKIMYVLGTTPKWLATGNENNYLNAPGGNSMPASLAEWDKWVTTVVTHAKAQCQAGWGCIDEYQVWNEVNFSSFWNGTPAQMVELTRRASNIIRRIDPSAEVVTGSNIVRQFKGNKVSKQSAAISKKSFFYSYMKGLKAKKVKFDAVGMHFYPWFKQGPGDGSPADRESGIRQAQQVLDHFKYDQPMYDTEMAYGNRRNNGWPHKVYNASTGAAYLAQTYIYGMSNNVPEVYWYGWDDHVLGIDVTSPDGQVLLPGIAYDTVKTWMSYAKSGGCYQGKGGIHTCAIKQKGQKQYIVFRDTKSTKSYSVPKAWGVGQFCDIRNACTPIKKRTVKVGLSPLLLK